MSTFKIDNSYYRRYFTKQELALRDRCLQTNTLEEAKAFWNELLHPEKHIVNGKPNMDRPLNSSELNAVRNLLCRIDRVYFALVVSGGTEKALQRIATNKWLFQRCREVQRNPDGYLDLWPRAHYKSTIVTKLGIMQELLINPKLSVMIITYTNKFALEILTFIKKTFEFNEDLKNLFPEVLYKNASKEAPAGTWTQYTIFLKANIKGNAASLCYSAIQGGGAIGRHAQLLVYDDAVVPSSVTSVENRENTIKYINNSKNLGSPGQPIDRKWFVGTRYHQDDAYAYLIAKKAVIPRIYTATYNGQVDGELVFLNRIDWEKNYLTMDDYTLSCQMFMNPNLKSKSGFKIQDLKPYNTIPPCHIFIFVDPASTKKKNSDFTSISVIGVKPKTVGKDGGNVKFMNNQQKAQNLEKFLLDGVRDRMNLSETWDALKNIYLKWDQFLGLFGNNKYQITVYYEKYGQQRDVETLKTLQERDGVHFEIEPIGGNIKKEDRIGAMIPDLKRGNFKIPYYVEKYGEICSWRVLETSPDSGHFEIIYQKEPLISKAGDKRFDGFEEFSKDNSYNFETQERKCYPIVKTDVEGLRYDYVLAFIDEYLNFPSGRHDDCLDSVSRYCGLPLIDYMGEAKVYY